MALITGWQLPTRSRAVLDPILDRLGIQSAKVSSVARNPKDQARVMLDNCLKGIGENMGVYLAPGQSVIQIVADWAAPARATLLTQMEAKIREVGPANVSKHCLGEGATIEVFDLAQNSIPPTQHAAFVAACMADPNISKILVENGAFHIEVKKNVVS